MSCRIDRPFILLFTVSMVVPLILFSVMMWQLYSSILHEHTREAVRTAKIFQQHARNVFETHQLVAERIDERIQGMSWDQIERSTELRTFLRTIGTNYPQIDAIWLADRSGTVRNASRDLPAVPVDISERDYFQELSRKQSGLFIGHIVKPLVMRRLNFNVAFRRSNSSDAFDGVIIITVVPEYFTAFWNQAANPDDTATVMMRYDGAVLARSRGIDPERLTLSPDSEPMKNIRQAAEGSYISPSVHDGTRRIFGYVKLEKYNVYLFHGIATTAVMREWRQQAVYYGGFFAISMAVLALFILSARRHADKDRALREDLRRLNTELQESHAATENKRRLLAAVMDALPIGVAITDDKGGMVRSNYAYEQIWRGPRPPTQSVDDYSGYKAWWFDTGRPVEPGEWASARAVLKGESVTGQILRIERFDGSDAIVSNSAAPVYDSEGTITGCAVAIQDITALKRAEERLQKSHDEMERRVEERTAELAKSIASLQYEIASRKMAEKSLEDAIEGRLQDLEALRAQELILVQQNRHAAMGEMIGNIAHQWRQPLNTLGLFTQKLGFLYGSPGFTQEFVESSVAKSMEIIQYMSRTIDDFRTFFLAEREKTEFRVEDAVQRALSLVDAGFKEIGITIELDKREEVLLFGFPNEYAQVLLNIFINARDALTERSIQNPRLKITICRENGVSVVTVADNAGGVDCDIMEMIFDPYFTTKGPQQGTGIGLFMSKNIIENSMGGRLSVRNTEEGAEFRIEV